MCLSRCVAPFTASFRRGNDRAAACPVPKIFPGSHTRHLLND